MHLDIDTIPLTIRQVAAAMIKDETPQSFGMLAKNVNGTLYTCAIGGAARMLGVSGANLMDALSDVDRDGVPMSKLDLDYVKFCGYDYNPTLGATIFGWNDGDEGSLPAKVLNDPDVAVLTRRKGSITKAELGRKILRHASESTLNTVIRVQRKFSVADATNL